MLSKNLENSTSYDIFFYKFWKKARVYYTLSISRGGAQAPGPPLDLPLQYTHHVEMDLMLCSVCEQRVRGASEISKFLRDTIVSAVIFWNLHLLRSMDQNEIIY